MTAPAGRTPLLASARVARLATVDEAGYPHLVPVCYATDGRAYYSAIDAKPKRMAPDRLRRIRNLMARPRVALLVDHYEEDWGRLGFEMVQGHADVLDRGPEAEAALALLHAKYPQYRAMGLRRLGGPVIRIRPDRVVGWSARP
jgi:PPOX class probable F420-dependent enzyme